MKTLDNCNWNKMSILQCHFLLVSFYMIILSGESKTANIYFWYDVFYANYYLEAIILEIWFIENDPSYKNEVVGVLAVLTSIASIHY